MNKNLCKQSYNDLVEFTARLASYSTSKMADLVGYGHYESRADELAIRDAIFLSISIRRLVELTQKYDLIKKFYIPTFTAKRLTSELNFEESDLRFNLWETIQNIIHAKHIELLKDDASFHTRLAKPTRDVSELFKLFDKKKSINGIILIESDRGDIKIFELYKMIKEIVLFTEEIDEFLGQNGIFVGELFE